MVTTLIIAGAITGGAAWLGGRAYFKHASLPVTMAFELGRAVERGVGMVHRARQAAAR